MEVMESLKKSIGSMSQMSYDERKAMIHKLLGINVSSQSITLASHVPVYDDPIIIDPIPLLRRYGVQRRQQHISFDWIIQKGNINECDRESYRKAYQYAKSIHAYVSAGKGLILKGSVGTGKTTLAIAIMREAVEHGIRCQFISNISLQDTLLNLLNSNRQELANYEKSIRTVPLLVIDDFGAESDRTNQSWIVDKIGSIIGERYDAMLPTIITTNLSRDELKSRYHERIYDRLRETCEVINFKGDSLRKR